MKVSVQEDEDGQPVAKVSGTMEAAEEQPSPPTSTEIIEPKRSEFAAVVFDQTAETYPVDANVECCYTLTTDIQPSSRDWVGLFKVGWLSPRDYLYYEWAPAPPAYEPGKEAEAKIVFPADRLPKDDGEFYQFCYVSSASSIRGASTPFQFKRPSAEDYIELDDSDSEMLVIRPKAAYLEEEVTKYRKLVHSMETEREGLVEKLRRARAKADNYAQDANQLRGKLEDMTCAMRDMSMAHDEVKLRLEAIEKEREELNNQVVQEEEKVEEYQKKIRALEAERDELAGRNSNLSAEVSTHREAMVDLETEVRNVATRLQQTEDQLEAAHQMKKIMEEELEAYKLSQDKLSRDLETVSGQNHALKEQLQLMEVGFADELKVMRAEDQKREAEFEALRKKLELTQQENFVLLKQLDDADKNSHVSQEAAASLFALQKANDALKARHDKMSAALEEKEKEMATFTRQSRQKERELRREAEDYKQRVEMCKTEYKTLLAENSKLRHKLGKYRKRNNDEVLGVCVPQEEKATETMAAVTKTVACQQAVTLVNSSNDASTLSTSDAATDTDSAATPSSTPEKLEALATELESRRTKKDRYKRLYLEEKERGDMLRTHYYEELQQKEMELESLRRQAAEEKDQLKQQILTMQNYLEQKEQEIQELHMTLRDSKVEENPSASSSLSYPAPAASPRIPDDGETQLVHGNPYQRGSAVYYRPTTEEDEDEDGDQTYEKFSPDDDDAGARNQLDLEVDGEPTVLSKGGQLPPPLQPEVLPEARLAAVRQQLGMQAAAGENDDQLFEDCAGYAGAMPSAPSAPEHQEDEGFMDAIGEGMKICPVCELHIATMSDTEFAEHVVSHFGRLCPMCKIQADDSMSPKDFEDHVSRCCENARHSRSQ